METSIEQFKQTLLDLIAIESTADKPENLNTALKYVEQIFSEKGLHIEKYSKNGKPSIVITTKESKSPQIMLSGHVDVVPAMYEGAFQPKVDGEKVYGRGASDMKGTDVAMIYALLELYEEDPSIDLGLMLTTDEEVGGFNGTNYLLDECGYSAEYAFVPDGGNNWSICISEKGVFHVLVTTTGKSAHGSRPWLGENAVEKLIAIYNELRNEFETKFGTPTLENNWLTTMNLGYIKGGENTNSVPDHAEMKLDIRHTKEIDYAGLHKLFSEVIAKNGGKFDIMIYGFPTYSPEDSDLVKSWKKALNQCNIVENPDFVKTHGASDGRFFAAKKIPLLIVKPRCSEIHIDNEWIDLNSLITYKDVLKKWILEVSKK